MSLYPATSTHNHTQSLIVLETDQPVTIPTAHGQTCGKAVIPAQD